MPWYIRLYITLHTRWMKKSRLCHIFCRLSRRWRPAFEGVESDSFNCIVWVFGFRYNNAILSCQSGNFVLVLIPSWHGWFSCYPRDIVGNIHSSSILVIWRSWWRSWWRAQRMMPIRWNAIECHDINWFGFTKVCSIYTCRMSMKIDSRLFLLVPMIQGAARSAWTGSPFVPLPWWRFCRPCNNVDEVLPSVSSLTIDNTGQVFWWCLCEWPLPSTLSSLSHNSPTSRKHYVGKENNLGQF